MNSCAPGRFPSPDRCLLLFLLLVFQIIKYLNFPKPYDPHAFKFASFPVPLISRSILPKYIQSQKIVSNSIHYLTNPRFSLVPRFNSRIHGIILKIKPQGQLNFLSFLCFSQMFRNFNCFFSSREKRSRRSSSPMEFDTPKSQVIIVPDENPCRGSGFKDPIEIDDEVEVLEVMKINPGSSRKNPIVVEQPAKFFPILNLRRKRFHTAKKRLIELPWFGKPVVYIGESSGTTMQEKVEIELANSSSSVYLQPDSNCEICTESKYSEEMFPIVGCSHRYCKLCVGKYVASELEKNVLFIKCPSPDCISGKLEPEMCSRILEGEMFDRWCMALCESVVGDKFYCPFKDCSALMIDDKEKMITEAECPHCRRMFCAQCMSPWHAGLSCGEFQSLSNGDRQREDLMLMNLAKKREWQRCPNCKFIVEKTDGCMFIKCRCGFIFCYRCATRMEINHFCVTCNT